MTEEKTVSFQGELNISDLRTVQCAVTIRYDQWNPLTLAVDLLWLGDNEAKRHGGATLRHLRENHLWLNSLDGYHLPVELLGITGISFQSYGTSIHSSQINVSAVQIGITKTQLSKNTRFNVIARLQPSGILCLPTIHNQMFTGEVILEQIETGAVELVVKGGKLEARETYEYNERELHGDKVTDRIQRATMLGEIEIDRGGSLWDIHEEIKKKLYIACSALSLCYRQTIDFYEIEYLPLDNEIGNTASVYRRRWPKLRKKINGDELINTRSLIEGGLEKLINSIESLDRSEDIHRAIRFLANSYEETAETAFFMAFSAMETIVSCCLTKSDEVVSGSSDWKKIEKTLKEAIRNNLDSGLHEDLISRLPELKRQALKQRIKVACEKMKPKTDDLWKSLSFEEGINRAASIRNGLFHAATAKHDSIFVYDLIRIRHFSERLLLKLIGWKDEDIWVWYDQQLKWVNANDH